MATDVQRDEDHGGGLSRRQVLARGAVAAGVVWAAPVIRTASAYATSAAGTERPCSKFYLVCIDQLGARPVKFPNPEVKYDEIPKKLNDRRREVIDAGVLTDTTTSTSSTTTTSTSTTTTSTTTTSTTTTTTTLPPTTTTTKPKKKKKTASKLPDPTDEAATHKKKPTTTTTNPSTAATSSTTTTTTLPELPLTPDASEDFGLFPITADPTNPLGTADPLATVPVPAVDNLPPKISDWLRDNPDVPVRYPEVPPMLTQTGDDAWAILLPHVEGPDPATHQCRGVQGWAQSKDKYEEYYVDPDPPDNDQAGLRLIFPNPRAEDAADASGNVPRIENLMLVYCCP